MFCIFVGMEDVFFYQYRVVKCNDTLEEQEYHVHYTFDGFRMYFAVYAACHEYYINKNSKSYDPIELKTIKEIEDTAKGLIGGGVMYNGTWTEWIHFDKKMELYFSELSCLFSLSKEIESYCKKYITSKGLVHDESDHVV